MTGLQYLGIACVLYTAAVYAIAFLKPAPIWNLGKIQGFVKSFGEMGTVVFFSIWGTIIGAVGVWLLLTQG